MGSQLLGATIIGFHQHLPATIWIFGQVLDDPAYTNEMFVQHWSEPNKLIRSDLKISGNLVNGQMTQNLQRIPPDFRQPVFHYGKLFTVEILGHLLFKHVENRRQLGAQLRQVDEALFEHPIEDLVATGERVFGPFDGVVEVVGAGDHPGEQRRLGEGRVPGGVPHHARLADGSRVNAIIPPLALDGPSLTIRRFGSNPLRNIQKILFTW